MNTLMPKWSASEPAELVRQLRGRDATLIVEEILRDGGYITVTSAVRRFEKKHRDEKNEALKRSVAIQLREVERNIECVLKRIESMREGDER